MRNTHTPATIKFWSGGMDSDPTRPISVKEVYLNKGIHKNFHHERQFNQKKYNKICLKGILSSNYKKSNLIAMKC
jgi:hypothetical protein